MSEIAANSSAVNTKIVGNFVAFSISPQEIIQFGIYIGPEPSAVGVLLRARRNHNVILWGNQTFLEKMGFIDFCGRTLKDSLV